MSNREQFNRNMKIASDLVRNSGQTQLAEFTDQVYIPMSNWMADEIERIQMKQGDHLPELTMLSKVLIAGLGVLLAPLILTIAKPGHAHNLTNTIMNSMTNEVHQAIDRVQRRETDRKINTV